MAGPVLFEFEDLRWFPPMFRGFATDWLRTVQARFRVHRPMVDIVQKLVARSGAERVVDLCAGSGGPLIEISRALHRADRTTEIVLTDLYPHSGSLKLPPGVRLHAESVDARDVPAELSGCRTLFSGFHHFSEGDGRRILENAAAAMQPIAVFEIVERRPLALITVLLIPILVWGLTPFTVPFRWSRLFWTYLVPVVPLVCFWDGVVSHLRVWSGSELQQLAEELSTDRYLWEAGRRKVDYLPMRVSYLTGCPRPCTATAGEA